MGSIVSPLLFLDIQNIKGNQPFKLSKRPKSWCSTKCWWKFKLIISVQFNVSKLVKIFASWFQAKIRQRGRRDFLLRSQSFFNPLLAQLVTANPVYQLIHSRISKVVDSAHESWVDRQTALIKEGSREKRHLSLFRSFPTSFSSLSRSIEVFQRVTFHCLLNLCILSKKNTWNNHKICSHLKKYMK